eukprot:scaffold51988_cov59-Phaeocystis_antarctica.AAC.6
MGANPNPKYESRSHTGQRDDLPPEPEDRLRLPRVLGDGDAQVVHDEAVAVPVAGRRRVEPAQPPRVRAQVEQCRKVILGVARLDLQLQRVEQSGELEACERPQAVPRGAASLSRVFGAAVAAARRTSRSDAHQRHRQVVPLLSTCLGVVQEDGRPEGGRGVLTRARLAKCPLAVGRAGGLAGGLASGEECKEQAAQLAHQVSAHVLLRGVQRSQSIPRQGIPRQGNLHHSLVVVVWINIATLQARSSAWSRQGNLHEHMRTSSKPTLQARSVYTDGAGGRLSVSDNLRLSMPSTVQSIKLRTR